MRHYSAPARKLPLRSRPCAALLWGCLVSRAGRAVHAGLSAVGAESVAMGSDFYLRYYVGHKGKFGHEFLEFEFRPDSEGLGPAGEGGKAHWLPGEGGGGGTWLQGPGGAGAEGLLRGTDRRRARCAPTDPIGAARTLTAKSQVVAATRPPA